MVPFHVAELPHVVLQLADRGPAEQRVADRLQRLLVLHHPLALVGVPRRIAVHVLRQHRPTSLLELKEDHVLRAAPFQQRHVRPQAHAADANDLVRDVDEGVATERAPPMRRQGVKIARPAPAATAS